MLQHGEGLLDRFEGAFVRYEGPEDRRLLVQEIQRDVGLVVAAADGDEGYFLATEFVEVDGRHRLGGDAGNDKAAAAGDGVAGGFERAVLRGAVHRYVDSSAAGGGLDFS